MTPRSARPARKLSVTVTDALGRRRAATGLARWLERTAPGGARGSLTIALVSDQRMRSLNRRFRGVDAVTDVLSFPEKGSRPDPLDKRFSAQTLGDLAIALGVAARQARAEGHTLRTELKILALHGLLHLLGYDHERDQGTMRRAEDRLRRRGGLPAGLLGRSSQRTTGR
jgi:probable rRNA maturation factor